MDNAVKITTGFALGLFLSSLYLGSSFLASYLTLCWNLWNPATTWFLIGVMTYASLWESESKLCAIGIFSIAGMWIYYIIAGIIPPLWIYIVVNSIVCLNIIITCIKKRLPIHL